MLQAYLEVVLVDELGGSAARALYSRSAQLLEQAGQTAAAVRAHARAEDWGAVGRLLQHTVSSLPADDDRLWASMGLSGALADDPGLLVASARRLWRDGMIAEAVTAFRQAEGLMDDPDFRARWADERAIAAVWLPDADVEPGRAAEHPPRATAGPRAAALPAHGAGSRMPRAMAWSAGSTCC